MVEHITAIRRFVTNLFTRYGHSTDWPEVKKQYYDHLSKYILPDDQWSTTLSDIVSSEDELPSLAIIDSYVIRKRAAVSSLICRGWLIFTLHSRRQAVRIEKVDGVWVYAKAEARSREKGTIVLQKRPGQTALIPKSAIDVLHVVDDPANPEPEEIPSKAEIAEIFAANWTGSADNLVKNLHVLRGPEPVNNLINRLL